MTRRRIAEIDAMPSDEKMPAIVHYAADALDIPLTSIHMVATEPIPASVHGTWILDLNDVEP